MTAQLPAANPEATFAVFGATKPEIAGCNHLVTKPVDFDALEPLLEHYLEH